jgi:UDPglucose--hexose-1-phosphate uridylyltransferase
MARLEFAALRKETVLLDPKDGSRRVIPSEIREDPLTGRTARICHFMKLQWQKPDFDELVAGTESWCPFCPERVLGVTPSFPPEIIPDGRLQADDMVLFPNLAPYDALSAVATLGGRHFFPMAEIEPERIARAFGLAMRFFRALQAAKHPESVYHIINWNHMPPAGSSLIHSHLQVFASSNAPNLMRAELEAAREYRDVTGTNYWDDLVAAERADGRRYLGRIGRTDWLVPFAPMGVAGDVLAVVEGARATLDLSEGDLADLGAGLARSMAAYDAMGIYSFNVNLFTGADGDHHSRVHLLFSPRTFFNQALGTTDVGALRNLYNETLCMAFPEEIADLLRPHF